MPGNVSGAPPEQKREAACAAALQKQKIEDKPGGIYNESLCFFGGWI